MDLKTFAVNRKLEHNHELLRYVVNNTPVPCDVLEESLKEVIEPLEDIRASMLVNDYARLLREEVPIICKRDPDTNDYNVSGEVSDEVLDCISLVHGATPEDAIGQMIAEAMRELGNQSVLVSKVNLKDQVDEMLAKNSSVPPVQNVATLLHIEETVLEQTRLQEEETKKALEQARLQEAETKKALEQARLQEEETKKALEQARLQEAETKKALEQAKLHEEAISHDQSETFGVHIESTEESVDEEADDAPVMTNVENDIMSSIQRIYTKLVLDIKSYGLDSALGLAI